jgi:putative two-component system response regulator
MALNHHEKWNGQGYPQGLAEEQIPISARIMAVADVFDALCSMRSYKLAYTVDEAFAILLDSKGSHFEPALVDAMVALKPKLEEIYN